MTRHTFRDIAIFVAAYEERSFTAAAQRENATQSGVSQHIRKLEDGFGVKLFTREAGTVKPTPAGDEYYRSCIRILHASSEAERGLRGHGGGLTGQLHIGLMPTMTRFCIARPVRHFGDENPNARIRISEGYSGSLTDRVASGELDFAIVPAAAPRPGLSATSFCETPEMLVCGPGSVMFGREAVTARDLQGARLLLPSDNNARRARIEAFLASRRIQPSRVLELDSMMGTLDILRSSDYVAILPALMLIREIRAGAPVQELHVPRTHPVTFRTELVTIERSREAQSPVGADFLARLSDECCRLLASVGLSAEL